jgi:peptidoglycan/LPS O-acetylase OafA/YrhL
VPGLAGGFAGVDVFFVLSGFVITGVLLRSSATTAPTFLLEFYERRIRRIIPAASVTLAVTVLAAYVILGLSMDPALPGDVRWATLFSANFHFAATATPYLVNGVQPSLVLHFWSLAVEEQFYLVWPLVVFVVTRTGPRAFRMRRLLAVTVAIIAASALWSLVATWDHPTQRLLLTLHAGLRVVVGCVW